VQGPGGLSSNGIPRFAFTRREQATVDQLRTPFAVQKWLHALPYNRETRGETLRSFRGVMRRGRAHCLEAALAAAVILEQHGDPPLLLSLASVDKLDHVLFAFRRDGRWGSVGRSRDPGLHGRRAVFSTPRQLAASYMDPYVDLTGRIVGFAIADLRDLGPYDWRLNERNVRRVERWLIDYPHRRIGMSDARYRRLHQRYRRYRARYPDRKPLYYDNRHSWM
jgi:hypothetical protein